MALYHGTHIQHIRTLTPIANPQNAITKSTICFTPNPNIALFYIWNRAYKWVAFGEEENGHVVFTEYYKNMLYDFYRKTSGSIYECESDNPNIRPTHMKGVYISEVPVVVQKEIIIPDVYEEICKQSALGNIIVREYAQLTTEEKVLITKRTIMAIHREKLLFPTNNKAKTEKIDFVRYHFPKEWEYASKMKNEEITKMENQWRAYLKTRQ